MKKQWSYFTTNYRQAWIEYRRSDEFRATSEVLKQSGIKQPYRNNILQSAFAAGWNATGSEIKQVQP
jgi:hypothetical protein